MNVNLGEYNTLRVVKHVDFGVYLDGGDDGEILLPLRYVPEGCDDGDEIEVFIYLDNEERLVATTLHPKVKVGEFAVLEVSWVNNFGAFLDWGLMKDLFIPFREQKAKMRKDGRYMIHCHIDDESYRIVGSAKVEKYLSKERPGYSNGDAVDVLVWEKTELGYKVIVDNKFYGLIYNDQLFHDIEIGDRFEAYVNKVRDDGKIDILPRQLGYAHIEDSSARLLDFIRSSGGHTHLCDKSPADEIAKALGMSKKTFKKSVGDLYKQRLITIAPDGLTLVK